jgi:hypothetical protein
MYSCDIRQVHDEYRYYRIHQNQSFHFPVFSSCSSPVLHPLFST